MKYAFVVHAPLSTNLPGVGYVRYKAGDTVILDELAAKHVLSENYPYRDYFYLVAKEEEEEAEKKGDDKDAKKSEVEEVKPEAKKVIPEEKEALKPAPAPRSRKSEPKVEPQDKPEEIKP